MTIEEGARARVPGAGAIAAPAVVTDSPTGAGARRHATVSTAPGRTSSLRQLRAIITVELLHSEMERLLLEEGRPLTEWHDWKPVLAQVRISSADTKWSTMSSSPERQVKHLARYCVRHAFRPVEMCFEAQSGSLTDLKPRKLLESYFQRLEAGELQISAIVTYNIDRFTRDRYTGERWLRMLLARQIDLHEADEMEPPAPLASREHEYARKLLGAWRESKRTSKRIHDARRDRGRTGGLVFSIDHYGHKPVHEMRNGRRVQVRGVIVPEEAQVLQEATRRLHEGESLNSIVFDLNGRGLRGRYDGKWCAGTLKQQLTSPRLAGFQRFEGMLKRQDIQPILSEEQWRRNCEILDAATPSTASKPKRFSVRSTSTRQRSNSDLLRCAVCGAPMRINKGPERSYYICSRPELRGLSRSRYVESGEGDGGAHGMAHATRNREVADEWLIEVAVATAVSAAHESSTSKRDPSRRLERERARLHTRLVELDTARRELAREQRRQPARAEDFDDALRERAAEADGVRRELANLERRAAQIVETVRSPEQLRERALADPSFVRSIIDHCVVTPRDAPGYGSPYRGIEVAFVAPYSLSDREVADLAERLNASRARRLRRRLPWPPRSRREDGELAFELHERGFAAAEIARRFNEQGPPPRFGARRWAASDIHIIVRRICDERDIPYQPHPNTRSPYEPVTRRLVYELLAGGARSYKDVAADLAYMRVPAPNGETWTANTVRSCYVAECALRGVSLREPRTEP